EVAIEGKLTTRSYDDKAGQKRYITEIIVNELVMLGRKEKAA
ncbi:MAG: single-stranded DNA-binding protein, partial [Flavobacteriales bacterium]|nr:single-stranded DNA-binding protein [Flavobacteriales bacterium]